MASLLVLPGDGIGPEVSAEALRVVDLLLSENRLQLEVESALLGGAALDASGDPAPEKTLAAAVRADAVLLGAVGGPAWDAVAPELRPEAGLLRLRAQMQVYANLRPAFLYPGLAAASSLRRELVEGLDILIVRELTGGIYFGQPRALEEGPPRRGFDTMVYDEDEIRRVAQVAFAAAGSRNQRLCSVDKANVLASSRLWRSVVTEMGQDYPQVELSHLYVDNAAMQLARSPLQFDVLLAGNLFGDILSDLAGALTGSIGMLPSAAVNASGAGLYEPCHGAAPDIAGQGLANPIAAILSLAMLLRHSLRQPELGDLLEQAVRNALAAGLRTADLAVLQAEGESGDLCSTVEAGDRILAELKLLLQN